MAELKKILNNITVADIIKGQKIVWVKAGDNITDVAKVLIKNKISSVPVFEGDTFDIEKCVGLIDFSDISLVLIELLEEGYTQHDPRKNIWTKFHSMPIKDAIKLNASKYVRIKVTDPILEVIDYTANFAFRRMLAIDEDNTVAGVISPSEMFRHIVDALGDKTDKLLEMSLSDHKIGSTGVISVEKNKSVKHAIEIMKEQLLTALAVIDDKTGVLTANFSVSDIAMIVEKESADLLTASVWKFITQKKNTEVDAVYPYFTISIDSSLRSGMDRILATNVHHLYVVDKENKPVKVIGYADLCRGLLAVKHRA